VPVPVFDVVKKHNFFFFGKNSLPACGVRSFDLLQGISKRTSCLKINVQILHSKKWGEKTLISHALSAPKYKISQ
jgi:hypothetical protein